MSKTLHVKWLSAPKAGNYSAAASYLSLIYPLDTVNQIVQDLHSSPITRFLAKDIFRASGLPLLGISNDRVEHDRKKIKSGKKLSPLLLVRDTRNGKVVIADGYHRMCALYRFHESVWIECKIV